jgi:hypothetical protein
VSPVVAFGWIRISKAGRLAVRRKDSPADGTSATLAEEVIAEIDRLRGP